MKTKTFLLLCLFGGFGLIQLSAQSNDKNINHSYAYWLELTGDGIFPITCDGVDFDMLYCYGKIHFVDHWANGAWQWEIGEAKWEATSIKTGEVFQGKELDKGIIWDNQNYSGTWRAIMHGNMGSHYQITVAVSYTPDGYSWSLIKAHCF